MTLNNSPTEVVLVAVTEEDGRDWLDYHDIDPQGVHIVTDAEGFRTHVREGGLDWRLAHDDEVLYFKILPEMLQRELGRWLFHHPPKRR